MIGHPGQFAFPELGDPGEREGYSVLYCAWYISALEVHLAGFPETRAELELKPYYAVDTSVTGNVTEMLLIRHGCIAAARAGYELELSVAAYTRETHDGADLWWWPLRLCPVSLEAGLDDPIRRRFDVLGAPPGGVAEHFEALGVLRWISPWGWQSAATAAGGDRYSPGGSA